MKTQRKTLMTLILIIAAALLLTASAFAMTFDLSDITEDITVSKLITGQHEVTYGSYTKTVPSGEEVEFTGTGESSITIKGVVMTEPKITLRNVHIARDGSPIYIGPFISEAVITIRGDNTLTNSQADSNDGIITLQKDPISVLARDLTINGDGKLTLAGDTNGAKIGSYAGDIMSNTIHITDNVEIITYNDGIEDGACIGSGKEGNFTGEVKIDGNAKVTAHSNRAGAGIGSGYKGDFLGRVNIGENANVTAISDYHGAGIGSGGYGGDFNGNVTIGGNATVYAKGRLNGAGIGSGYEGDFASDGKVIIGENANVTAISTEVGAGIGCGFYGDFAGNVTIGGSATVYAKSEGNGGTGIGCGEAGSTGAGKFIGKVTIEGNADVTAISNRFGAGIGTGEYGSFKGDVIIRGNATVYAEGGENGAGIGTGQGKHQTDGFDTFTGTITIADKANVTAIGEGKAPALGGAYKAPMKGTITIKDNTVVTVCAGDESSGCIIGANGNDSVDSTGKIEILGKAKILRHKDHPEDFALIGANLGSFTGEIKIENPTTIFGRNGRYVNLRCYVPRNDGTVVIVKYYAPPPPPPAHVEPAKKYEIKLDPNRGETTAEKLITDENGKVANFPDAQRKGYVFMGWYDALTGGKKVDGNTVFTKNTTIYAMWKMDIDGDTFAQKKAETTRYLINAINASSNMFTVSVKASDGGWINPKETRTINYGGNLTVSAFPDGGKKVVSFIVDGEDKGSINTYTFKNIKENHTVEVVFG